MSDLELLVPEFEYRPKGIVWHIVFGILATSAAALAWFFGDRTFTTLIAVIWMILIMRQFKKPALVTLRIDDKGLSIGTKTWEYKELKNFSIAEIETKKRLVITPSGRFQVAIKIPISDPSSVAAKLNHYLSQVEYEESLLESLA